MEDFVIWLKRGVSHRFSPSVGPDGAWDLSRFTNCYIATLRLSCVTCSSYLFSLVRRIGTLNCAIGRLYAVPIPTDGGIWLLFHGEHSAVSAHGETTHRVMDLVVNNLRIPVYVLQIYEHYQLSDSYFRLVERLKRTRTLKHLIISANMNLSQRLIDTLVDCALSLKFTLRFDRTRGSPLELALGQGGHALFAPGFVRSFIERFEQLRPGDRMITALRAYETLVDQVRSADLSLMVPDRLRVTPLTEIRYKHRKTYEASVAEWYRTWLDAAKEAREVRLASEEGVYSVVTNADLKKKLEVHAWIMTLQHGTGRGLKMHKTLLFAMDISDLS